ncbi:MAG TPA: tRNA pseudouridine(55) synthase TruB [Bacilli bacterium]
MIIEGVLPIIKPVDFTSHDVVAKVRRILGIKRIGHTGTLDPKVTGVLPLCIGRATRVVEYIQDLPKEYEARLILGIRTDTEDMTGNVLETASLIQVTEEQVTEAIHSFVGLIEQIPPMYSAVKVNGKRLYELARNGEEIERQPRTVTIHHIDLIHMNLELLHPAIQFRVSCSKGTYIRTLCADIGKKLGVPAVMSELVRTATGSITIDQCVSIEETAVLFETGRLGQVIIPTDLAIPHLPFFSIPVLLVASVLQGKSIPTEALKPLPASHLSLKAIKLYAPDGIFLGIFKTDMTSGLVQPVKVFN